MEVLMTYKTLIQKEIKKMPEELLAEVVDFIKFLQLKMVKDRFDITFASESSLKKDWLKPEEDDVWKNL